MIELNQICCFLAIVEQGSFSKAAENLGLAQSAVSQKLVRLEDQLGIRLLDRTSRRVQLSRSGAAFLPFAQQMIEAENSARNAARRLAEDARSTVRLGGYAFSSDARVELTEAFLTRFPDARITVDYGTRDELLNSLRQNKIDAFLCIAGPAGPIGEFHGAYFRRLAAYIALPPEHRFAGSSEFSMDDLRGERLVISPGRQDAPVLDHLCKVLIRCGVELHFAPEAERRSLALYARRLNLPSLRWLAPHSPVGQEDGFPVIPITGDFVTLDHYLYTRKGAVSPLVERLRNFTSAIADDYVTADKTDTITQTDK